MTIKAEYIWIDGTEPTPLLRSKTKVLHARPPTCPSGASTDRAPTRRPGKASDCVLKPVFSCPDPIRGGANVLVLCEVLLTDFSPHPTNTRAALVEVGRASTPSRSRCSASSRSTPCSRAAGPSASRSRPATRRRRGPTTAGSGADDIYGRPAGRGPPRRLPGGRPRRSRASTPRSCPASGSSRSARSARSRYPTSCGSPAGCCTASARISASR